MNPDVALFHLLNDFVGRFLPLDWLARAIVNDFAVPTAMSLLAVWMWFAGESADERLRNQRAVLIMALGVLFANALIKDLSYIYFRPRPFATDTVKLLFYRPSVSSFPSVPIAVAFCFVAGAWHANRGIAKRLLTIALLYALSRVYAGVHYPLDVIGGAAIGAGAVYTVERLSFVFYPLADACIAFARRFSFA